MAKLATGGQGCWCCACALLSQLSIACTVTEKVTSQPPGKDVFTL